MVSSPAPLVTLTTDFGTRDPYVAAMKGILYRINRRIHLADMTHDIAPHDVFEAALFLSRTIPHYPPGTVHVAVVDPGVGTERHPIALLACEQYLVCPDNGLPTFLLREHPLQEARIITNPEYMLQSISSTFHGRDVFAPAAAHLASGVALDKLGNEIDTIVTLDIPSVQVGPGSAIKGEIIHVDRFGNLITNIRERLLEGATPDSVWAGRQHLSGLKRAYAEVPHGSPLALFGSSGYLEIAVNGGSANAALRLGRGDAITLKLKDAPPKP